MNAPRPRSREEAGTLEEYAAELRTGSTASITSAGGEARFERARLTVPVGAVIDPVFVELEVAKQPPGDVLPDSAVQINPNGFELLKDALLAITYYDGDIPPNREETDIALVQQVNGVWIEVPNAEVLPFHNTVQAPIRYFGLYALRLRSIDERVMNAEPTVLIEFSREPFPGMLAPPPAAEPTEAAPEAVAPLAPAPGVMGPVGPQQTEGQPPASDAGQASSRIPGVQERRVVAGPEDEGGPQAPAANAAEGEAPVREEPVDVLPTTQEPDVATKEIGPGADADLEGALFYFDGSGSADPDGRIVQYDWDFDSDGIFDYSTYRGPYARHRFLTNGDYTVTLKVTDNGRYPRSGYGTIVVQVRDPQLAAVELSANIAAFPPSGAVPLTVRLASSVTGGQPPYAYNWTFSDGSQSNMPNPFTTYPNVEDHVISFSVTDVGGASLNGNLSVNPTERGEQRESRGHFSIALDPGTDRGTAPLTSSFAIQADRATEPVTYRITFGDEGPGEGETVTSDPTFTHTYGTSGFYIVKVIATDANLRTATTFGTVTSVSPDMARDFATGSPDSGDDAFSLGHGMHIGYDYTEDAGGRTVRFAAEDTPAQAGGVGYQWDFGDGNFSTEESPAHTYARDGVYEVRLTASDGEQRYRHRIWLPISEEGPAVAVQSPRVIEGPAPLRLNWDAIVTRGDQPMLYDWSFGTARRSDPRTYYSFTEPGEYLVNLTVKDANGQSIKAPVVKVNVLPGATSYRQALAVVEPVQSGTRAVVMDYAAKNPLPLSSPAVEGNVSQVSISSDGRYAAEVTPDGVIVKKIADGQAVASFLPSSGSVLRAEALDSGAALATQKTSAGLRTVLVRAGEQPVELGQGMVLTASGSGEAVLLKDREDTTRLAPTTLYEIDPDSGYVGEAQQFEQVIDAQFTRDGSQLYFIGGDKRVVRRDMESGNDDYITGGDVAKSGLAVSADGRSVAYVGGSGDTRELYYGRQRDDGSFELTSVTDQLGFVGDHVRLGADGGLLLAYGSRNRLNRLVENARLSTRGGTGGASDPVVTGQPDPGRADKYGVIRLDLKAAPEDWTIESVSPRFLAESGPHFDNAGPF